MDGWTECMGLPGVCAYKMIADPYPHPPSCASTALSKHQDPSDHGFYSQKVGKA